MGSKKHKKHKSDRWGRYESAQGQGKLNFSFSISWQLITETSMKHWFFKYFTASTDRPQLRLILKVGGASTPDLADHGDSSSGMLNRPGIVNLPYGAEEDSRHSSLFSLHDGSEKEKHKKKKEKKKKKNKDKDKEKKKHKHKVYSVLSPLLLVFQWNNSKSMSRTKNVRTKMSLPQKVMSHLGMRS